MMRVLVTGGAGFIGSHLAHALVRGGNFVRVIDNLSTGQLWRIEELLDRIDWMHADVRDPDAARHAVDGVEVVLHQAALPSVARSLVDPELTNDNNVGGTVTMLEACRNAGVRRLVMAGSSSAYGKSQALPKVETMCPAPMSPYAVSKLSAEQYCQVFAQLGYVETIVLRYFNVFGPMQDPNSEYAAVIPKFIAAMLGSKPITLHGDGTQSRDFTYVENVVQANILAMEAPASAVSGQVFNIACGERYDLNCLTRRLAEILSVEPNVIREPARAGDVPHSQADISKAKSRLGYKPAIGFEAGLRRTAAWFAESSGKSPVLYSH